MGDDPYLLRLAALARELGIPPDYAASRSLSPQPEATEFTPIGRTDDDREILLAPPAAAAWFQLHASAARDGITLIPLSGFRSVQRQTEIIRAKLAAGQPIDAILRLVAAPGYSEHHTGRALDIGSPEDTELEESFAETPAYVWLLAHAPAHGFHQSYPRDNPHRIAFEPWHWCWRS